MSVMNLWKCNNWKNIFYNKQIRSGARLKFDAEVDIEVRRSCKEFLCWLRRQYYFPIRIPIYIKSANKIKALDGDIVSATFFEPIDYSVEPYIRIAAGEYIDDCKIYGKDNAIAGILHSIAHELTHYYQWINGIKLTEKGYEQQAYYYSKLIVYEYSKTRKHP